MSAKDTGGRDSLGALARRMKPGRRVDGIAAVLLPFDEDGNPDFAEFQRHVIRTRDAGLTPAVNMDTGFGPELGPEKRREVLRVAREALGEGVRMIAGAMPFGEGKGGVEDYRRSVESVLERGATPIVFPSPELASADAAGVAAMIREAVSAAPEALAFELGRQFAPFGRIFDAETFKRVLEIPGIIGLKHSSLSRAVELERLALRDELRPDFRIYTGNDLAIDMIMYGSDYLLGLATIDPEAFARRDAWWAGEDGRFTELNDALQAVGAVAFRDPVPAYKDSVAAYLKLTGGMKNPRPHPSCPKRPAWEADLLAPLASRVAAATRA